MRIHLPGLIAFIIFTFSVSVQGQTNARFATISKNFNVAAKSLKHDLNSSGDTLKLSSSDLIHRVYTAGKTKGMVDVIVNRKRFDLPLKALSDGKHIFVVQDLSRKIIFHVYIHESRGSYGQARVGE